MDFEVIEEYGNGSEVWAWISQPDQRDIGVQAIIERGTLSVSLLEVSDRTRKTYGQVYMSSTEFKNLLGLIDYVRG